MMTNRPSSAFLKRLVRYENPHSPLANVTSAAVVAIVGSQALDAVSHFLSVRADVLDRSPTDGSRNAGQAFQSGQAARHTIRDDCIPRFS